MFKTLFKEKDVSVKKRAQYLYVVERKCLYVPRGKRGCFEGMVGDTEIMGNPQECVMGGEQKWGISCSLSLARCQG